MSLEIDFKAVLQRSDQFNQYVSVVGNLFQLVGKGEQFIFQRCNGITRSSTYELIRRLIAKVV